MVQARDDGDPVRAMDLGLKKKWIRDPFRGSSGCLR